MSRLGDIAANIFDLLDESDGSNVESGKKAQAVLEQKKNAAAAALAKPVLPVEKAPQGGKKPTGDKKDRNTDKSFKDQYNKGERRAPRPEGERPPRPAGVRGPRVDRPPRDQNDTSKEENGRRVPRLDRKPRQEGDYVPRGNKREKDRESGTGRGKEAQKNGAGKGGWGDSQSETTAVEGVSAEQAVEELKKEEVEGETPTEATAATTEVKEAEPEEVWGRTVDDYFKEKKKATATLQIRQLEDAVQSGLTPLKRDDSEDQFIKVEKKSSQQGEKKEKDTKKKVVPVDQVLKVNQGEKKERAPREDRPPRGGRGGRGGPSSQGGERRKPASNNTPFQFDQSAFPTFTKA